MLGGRRPGRDDVVPGNRLGACRITTDPMIAKLTVIIAKTARPPCRAMSGPPP